MPKKKSKKRASKREYRPLYVAKKKKKAKFPKELKEYYACIAKGKGKRYCKKKHLSK